MRIPGISGFCLLASLLIAESPQLPPVDGGLIRLEGKNTRHEIRLS